MELIARSARAVIVRDGLTPGFADSAEPPTTYRNRRRYAIGERSQASIEPSRRAGEIPGCVRTEQVFVEVGFLPVAHWLDVAVIVRMKDGDDRHALGAVVLGSG
jgi:hypothetical protein